MGNSCFLFGTEKGEDQSKTASVLCEYIKNSYFQKSWLYLHQAQLGGSRVQEDLAQKDFVNQSTEGKLDVSKLKLSEVQRSVD